MLKRQVKIGSYYAIAHTSYNKLSVVQITGENRYGGYDAVKLSTGRTIRIKSAAKLRYEVQPNPFADSPRWLSVEAIKARQEELA
jgi:hypothetical protein